MGNFSLGSFFIVDTGASGVADTGTIPTGAWQIRIQNLGDDDATISDGTNTFTIGGSTAEGFPAPVVITAKNSNFPEITYDAGSSRLLIAASYS